MKIIFVLPDMPGGGTERVVALLANEYVKEDIKQQFYCLPEIRPPIP